MELASRGHRVSRGHGYNLPLDPRPTLDAIVSDIQTALHHTGLTTTVVEKPRSYGIGGAFRDAKWFATIPQYQHPGTSILAPEPGLQLPKHIPQKRQGPPRDPEAPLKPTRTWPREPDRLNSGICQGTDACQYEPVTRRGESTPHSNCRPQWSRHSRNLFNAFTQANPDVMFRNVSPFCIGDVRPHHRCNTKVHHNIYELPLDHTHLCRLPDGHKFIISQPYYPDELTEQCHHTLALWQQEFPELRWKIAGRERSWYFPNNSNLLFFGAQHTLDSLVLDYQVPTDSQPTGCVRFHKRS